MSLDVYLVRVQEVPVFSANYTHNVTKMAAQAGLYAAVRNPEQIGITEAGDLIERLRARIKKMEDNSAEFIALNPKNGWGSYDTFLTWLREYLEACEEHLDATVRVSR